MSTSTKNRFVLWIDILGFKNLIENQKDPKDVTKIIRSIVKYPFGLRKYSHYSKKLEFILISDTLIIATPDCTNWDLISLSIISTKISHSLLKNKLLFRGCISYGEFHSLKTRNGRTIFGETVVEAATLEPQINMLCIACATSVSNFLNTVGLKWTEKSEITVENYSEIFEGISLGHFYFLYKVKLKLGFVETLVVRWFPIYVAHLENYFYDLQKRVIEDKVIITVDVLNSIYSKLINSKDMITSVLVDGYIIREFDLKEQFNANQMNARWGKLLYDVKGAKLILEKAVEEYKITTK
jgi:hypothetical protein